MILQMAVKAINNLVRPNRIVPTLLIFGAYLWFTEIDSLSPSVTKRMEAIYTERQVKDVFAI